MTTKPLDPAAIEAACKAYDGIGAEPGSLMWTSVELAIAAYLLASPTPTAGEGECDGPPLDDAIGKALNALEHAPAASPVQGVEVGDFVMFCEPGDYDFPRWVTMRAEHAAEIYRRAFPERNYTAKEALDDFMVANWAIRVEGPPVQLTAAPQAPSTVDERVKK